MGVKRKRLILDDIVAQGNQITVHDADQVHEALLNLP